MNTLYAYNSFLRGNLLSLIGLCLCAYFSYHAIAGERGLIRLYFMERQIVALEGKDSVLEQERDRWQKKVVMLRPGSIDRDLLEEQARSVLGYRRADEYTVFGH
jgi:cell division protein FtsB